MENMTNTDNNHYIDEPVVGNGLIIGVLVILSGFAKPILKLLLTLF